MFAARGRLHLGVLALEGSEPETTNLVKAHKTSAL